MGIWSPMNTAAVRLEFPESKVRGPAKAARVRLGEARAERGSVKDQLCAHACARVERDIGKKKGSKGDGNLRRTR